MAALGTSGTLSFTNNGGYTLGAITASAATLSETASAAKITQANGTSISFRHRVRHAARCSNTNDTQYTLANGNSVGTLVANLGTGGALSYTDNTAAGYKLGAITAGTVTLGEDASGATVSQTGALSVSGTLTLNGAATNDTTYTLTGNNHVGTLTASLGDAGSGSALSYTDNGGSYALGAITADGVTLTENASSATIASSVPTELPAPVSWKLPPEPESEKGAGRDAGALRHRPGAARASRSPRR